MKAIKIRNTFWSTNGHGTSEPVFTAGQVLPADDEGALRQLALGNADDVDVPDPAPAEAEATSEPQPAQPADADPAPAPAAPARGKRAAG